MDKTDLNNGSYNKKPQTLTIYTLNATFMI